MQALKRISYIWRQLTLPKQNPHFVPDIRNEQQLYKDAIHETGHAILAILKPSLTDFESVTIVYDGKQLGHVTCSQPNKTQEVTKERLENAIMQDVAGRAAEEIIFSEPDPYGYVGDYIRARNMIDGMIQFGFINEPTEDNIHEDMLTEKLQETKEFLRQHETKLRHIAKALLIHKTLSKLQVHEILNTQDSSFIFAPVSG